MKDKRIEKGEMLFVMGGSILTIEDENGLSGVVVDKPIEISECFSIGPRDASELKRMPQHYVTHSCAPNAGFKGQIFMVAMRPILAGEEVTYDHAMVMHSNPQSATFFTMECHCASLIAARSLPRTTGSGPISSAATTVTSNGTCRKRSTHSAFVFVDNLKKGRFMKQQIVARDEVLEKYRALRAAIIALLDRQGQNANQAWSGTIALIGTAAAAVPELATLSIALLLAYPWMSADRLAANLVLTTLSSLWLLRVVIRAINHPLCQSALPNTKNHSISIVAR